MLPPPTCLTVGVVFMGLKVSPSLLKTCCCSFWPNNLLFVPSDHRVFLKKVFFPSPCNQQQTPVELWVAVSRATAASHVDTHLIVGTDTCLPAASSSLQTSFLFFFVWLILTNFLSAAGLCYLPDRGSDTTVCIYICSNTDAGTDRQRDG